MTYIVSGGALNSTHSLTELIRQFKWLCTIQNPLTDIDNDSDLLSKTCLSMNEATEH